MKNSPRATTTESMDHPEFGGEELDHVLRDLDKVNRLLFNYFYVTKAVLKLIKSQPTKEVVIMDLGCGGGGHLRHLANACRSINQPAKFIGIDHNLQVLDWAQEHSKAFPEITFLQHDATAVDYKIPACDILISSHFLYHFENDALLDKLKTWLPLVRNSILISSLHRSKLGALLFNVTTKLLRFHPISRSDGQSALDASFTKTELESILKPTFANRLKIKRRPFFRIITEIRHAL
ncbi:MAG: 2-polyprenyl-3-methyl-5-hydroxy-6-metoxy-1,4-benzoquinol methylase [Flavobacteriales bacterium]|jgi:2-polyprenyl-3-methyl-5-hydroxy-6-metoxy-1,4-benzoquinol methylase